MVHKTTAAANAVAAAASSKARLHCCGTSHHAHDHPAGVELAIHETLCYGTGDNLEAAVLLLPDGRTDQTACSWTSSEMRLLADRIARGANVTVLIPFFQSTSALSSGADGQSQAGTGSKRSREMAETSSATDAAYAAQPLTRASCTALATHLRDAMQVTHVALIGLFGEGAEIAQTCASETSTASLYRCAVVASDTVPSASDLAVPTVLFALGSTGDASTSEAPVAVRTTPIAATDASFLIKEGGEMHDVAMRELLFWCKKHLHEWS